MENIREGDLIDIGLDETMGDHFVFMRGLTLLPQVMKNIRNIPNRCIGVASERFEGDQYETSKRVGGHCVKDHEATEEDARSMIEKLDWSDYTSEAEDNNKH